MQGKILVCMLGCPVFLGMSSFYYTSLNLVKSKNAQVLRLVYLCPLLTHGGRIQRGRNGKITSDYRFP